MPFGNAIGVVHDVHDRTGDLIVRDPHAFTNAVAFELWKVDANWGHNIKRGNQGLSEDAVCYLDDTSPLKVRSGPRAGRGIRVVDIIASAGSSNAKPAWIDQTLATLQKGDSADWSAPHAWQEDPDEVEWPAPGDVIIPAPPVPPPPAAPAPPACKFAPAEPFPTALVLTELSRLQAQYETLYRLIADKVIGEHLEDVKQRLDRNLAAQAPAPKPPSRWPW